MKMLETIESTLKLKVSYSKSFHIQEVIEIVSDKVNHLLQENFHDVFVFLKQMHYYILYSIRKAI